MGRSRRRTKAAASAAAVALGVLGSDVLTARQASAHHVQPFELHHNIAGVARGNGSLLQTGHLKAVFNTWDHIGPTFAFSLNESCYHQAAELKAWAQTNHSLTYQLLFYPQRRGITACKAYGGVGNGDYGVAVLTLGGHTATSGPFTSQHANDPDRRGYACIQAGLPSPKYWFCSAHSYYGSATTSANQFTNYKDKVYALPGSLPIVWAGDLYRRPDQIQAAYPTFYSTNSEADQAANNPTSGNSNTKVDHLFIRRPREAPVHPAIISPGLCTAPTCGPGTWDHKLIGGYFQL